MNDQTLAKGKTEWWPLLASYMCGVAKHWNAVVGGIVLGWVDLLERAFGKWWVFSVWWRLTTFAIGVMVAQFLAYSDLHRARLNEREELRRKIKELSTKAYDQAQLDLVQDKVSGLDQNALDILRFLLQHGRTDHNSIERQMRVPRDILNAALRILRERMLATDSMELNTGRAGTTTVLAREREVRTGAGRPPVHKVGEWPTAPLLTDSSLSFRLDRE
jgi:hypothetical protein